MNLTGTEPGENSLEVAASRTDYRRPAVRTESTERFASGAAH
jgi:hypothetical protein